MKQITVHLLVVLTCVVGCRLPTDPCANRASWSWQPVATVAGDTVAWVGVCAPGVVVR